MNGYLPCTFCYMLLTFGCNEAVIISDCDVSCGDCCKDLVVGLECAPYYYLQPVPPPEPTPEPGGEQPLQAATDTTTSESATSSTTPSTITTTTTSTPTTPTPTTTDDQTTAVVTATTTPLEQMYICVAQCYPGFYGDNGTCYECVAERCALCSENGTRCLACENGWYLQGDGCVQFSPVEIALIALTCIFGAVVLGVVVFGIVMCVRGGICGDCAGQCAGLCACSCAWPCGSCACPKCCLKRDRSRPSSVLNPAPSKEDVLRPGVNRKSLGNQRYTREPTLRRKESNGSDEIVGNPQYPEFYRTPMGSTGQEAYDTPMEEDVDIAVITDETYDDVDDPREIEGVQIQEREKKGNRVANMTAFFTKKTSKSKDNASVKPKMGKKPNSLPQQVEQNKTVSSKPAPKTFVRNPQPDPVVQLEQQTPRPFKQAPPLPATYDDNLREEDPDELYNDVADPDPEEEEYMDVVPGDAMDPVYQNVQDINQGIAGLESQAAGASEPLYGNVPAVGYENAPMEGVRRPNAGRKGARGGRPDSQC